MAIQILSLTPVNPVIVAGNSVTFTITANETTSLPLSYLWEFSVDGGTTYTSTGLTNNTSTTYTTSNLTANQSGIRFRCRVSTTQEIVYSNTYSGIGERIVVVTASPLISLVSSPDSTVTLAVGSTLSLSVAATVFNVDATNTSIINNIGITWEVSTNSGGTWTTVTAGGTAPNPVTTVTNTTTLIEGGNGTYQRNSTLSISNITFAYNLYQYRARITYTNATNSPLISNSTIIYINPVINVYRQPGSIKLPTAGGDTVTTQCYKTGIANSGQAKFQVGALSTANTTLNYTWEYSVDGGTSWLPLTIGINAYFFRLKVGTNDTSDILELDRLIYFERFGIRCTVSGVVGELPVTTTPYYIYLTDVTEPVVDFIGASIVEDKYGNITGRDNYPEAPQTLVFVPELDVSKNNGLNGNVVAQYQRQDPGTSTWYDVGTQITYNFREGTIYEQFPSGVNLYDPITLSYETPPLRRSVDHNAKYRIKITSTSLFTLNGSTKVLTPYYSNEVTISVYRTAYINNQPTDATVYALENASFSINATPSSGTTISYQWQYNTTSSTTGWADVPGNSTYTGTTSSLLTINSVALNPTYKYFRCVINVPDSLSTVSSQSAILTVNRDLVNQISSLNDLYIDQFQPASWTVIAQSLSLRALSYQWQKSTNYTTANPNNATWTNITGQTTSTYSIGSVALTDAAYYRCRITSGGNEIAYTNAAALVVERIAIDILTNIPTTRTFLEDLSNEYTFTTSAISSSSGEVFYQWQYKRTTDLTYQNFGVGYNGSLSTSSSYTPLPFDRVLDNGAKIRCLITADGVPGSVTTNECTITVNRRFYYFADAEIKTVSVGTQLVLDLNSRWTGDTIPTYQWQLSTNNGSTWTNISGETTDIYETTVTSGMANYMYRCLITLSNVTQHQYSRNNATIVVPVSTTSPTVTVKLNVLSFVPLPIYYSKQTEKTGATVGTVIAVPKPSGYVHNPSATTDDISQWKVARSGALTVGDSAFSSFSAATSSQRPSWVNTSQLYNSSGTQDSTFRIPKWSSTGDRFPGYIELRGQWLSKSEFPALYAMIGDTYSDTVQSNKFKLPNLYGKKLMGTGNVNNNLGSVSIEPLYEPNGSSGGDKYVPGTIGGFWNYTKSAQLPPGNPNISGELDGTAGVTEPETFSIANYQTTGFDQCTNFAQPSFQGIFNWNINAMTSESTGGVPVHSHNSTSTGYANNPIGICGFTQAVIPSFPTNTAAGCSIVAGPQGVANPGIAHSHGMTINNVGRSSGGQADHGTGVGTSGSPTAGQLVNLQTVSGQPSMGLFLSGVDITMTNQSRATFNGSLAFYLRNNEPLPLASPYYRMKYLIKAY